MKWAILLSLFLSHSQAFTLNNNASAAFDKDDVVVNVDSNGCSNLSVTPEEMLGYAEAAVEKFWNTVPTSRLRLRRGSLQNVSSSFRTDLICQTGTNCTPNPALAVGSDILIACNNNATNFSNTASVLGVTVPNNISGRTIKGALILINDNGSNTFESRSYDEKVAIVAHEIGHAIGLGHSPVDDSLMYYQSVATRKRLGWDDIDGLTYLYPTEQPFSGCGSVDVLKGQNGETLFSYFTGLLFILLIFEVSKLRSRRKESL
ncbi:MAG: hypothetical protein Fur0010_20500 [Bdellovibrio sp.]